MQRREFFHVVASGTAAALLPGCGRRASDAPASAGRRVLIVAFDGLDPRIVESLIHAGRMPKFARLAKTGSIGRIATSNPPQTPVAFANIISGADPGLHQVFDFIHRDPNPANTSLPVRPHFSTADAARSPREWAIPLGSWQLPLSARRPSCCGAGRRSGTISSHAASTRRSTIFRRTTRRSSR
jgi:hypothetical protein